MRDLAARAGFSTATTYNLIGSKSTVLYALLNQSLDRVGAARSNLPIGPDPIEHVFQAADAAVNYYTADANFYRPLQRFLLSMSDPIQRPRYMQRAFVYWYDALAGFENTATLKGKLVREDLANQLMLSYAGVITLWVHDELDSQQFRDQIRTNVAFTLLALSEPKHRERLLDLIGDARTTAPILIQGGDLDDFTVTE
ncbi:conserved hypothetical protein [Novosphingobium sp. 9U]|nr:conserved hypothetical protein [Novosphingobium sp. 9U]